MWQDSTHTQTDRKIRTIQATMSYGWAVYFVQKKGKQNNYFSNNISQPVQYCWNTIMI